MIGRSLARNWDLAFVGALGAGVLVAALSWSPLAGYRALDAVGEAKVYLECVSGSCWLRRQGDVQVTRIPKGRTVLVRLGDEAVTLGEGSSLTIAFTDDGGVLWLRNTGIIRVAKGRKTVALDSPADSANSLESAIAGQVAPPPSSLVFVGDIPINIVSPVQGTPIVATKFPAKLHLAFTLDEKTRSYTDKLLSWSLVEFPKGASLRRVSTITVSHDAKPNGNTLAFYADFEVARPGSYGLIPLGMELGANDIKFRFDVSGKENLEGQLRNLLQGVSSDSNQQLEIRQ